MARSLILTAVLLVGCTRPNPAFNEFIASDDVGGTEQGEGETGTSETGTSETGTSVQDLPTEPVCEFEPSDGLDLKYGNASYFGGTCPGTVAIWVRVAESGGGVAMVETCSDGCQACAAAQPLSIFPLLIEDYLPAGGTACLKLEADVSLGGAPDVCQWGALSLFDGFNGTPYVIATAHSSEPTPLGLVAIVGSIPQPVLVGNCNCEDLGLGNDCCYMAPTPPEFWGYPWGDGELLLAGDVGEIPIPNDFGILHSFEVIQAQRIYDVCGDLPATFSWAVVAHLP